ncbi:MAG TPA: DUF167 domain-containing protein [Candidatus Limnocylindria bacterium]|nr:DUF167 domain-containing protein [Candidatus Limnocylindria bacterium]
MADLSIRVVPRASADRVGPYRDGVLAVRTTRPPTDGEANDRVVRLVARALDVAPSAIELVSGARGRSKRLRIAGLDADELERRLARIGAD